MATKSSLETDVVGHGVFEWSPILGGSAIAIAISIVLLQFGTGIGLSAADPILEGGTASWVVLAAGIWVVWVAAVSSASGGYVAGRMRTRRTGATDSEAEFRDGVHGVAVWAIATIGAMLGSSILTALASVGGAAASEAAEPSAEALRIIKNSAIIFAFSVAAGSALGLAAAWFCAIMGGEHRDNGVDYHLIVPAPLRKMTSSSITAKGADKARNS